MKKHFKDYLDVLKFVKPYKKTLLFAGFCMMVTSIFECISLGMIVPMSDRILNNKAIVIPGKIPHFLSRIVDRFNATEPLILLKFTILLLVILFFVKGITLFMQTYLMSMIGQKVGQTIRNDLYSKFQDLSLDFYARERTGELMSNVTNDVLYISTAITYGLTDTIYNFFQAFFLSFISLWLAVRISWKLPLICFVFLPLIMIFVVKIGKKVKKLSAEGQNKMADLNSLLAETIQGAYIVKVFGREEYELNRFKLINNKYYRFIMKGFKRSLMVSPFTEFVGVVGVMVILWIVGAEIIAGRASYGVFSLFLAALLAGIKPLKKLSTIHSVFQQSFGASQRVFSVLAQESSIKEAPSSIEINDLKDKISFDGVYFKYATKENYVLRNICLQVKKGETVALVGHSGAGKSTLVSLLPRLYDLEKGRILFDGVDIRNLKLKSIRSLFAIVSQEMVLFNATIRENISYGKFNVTEQEIIEAAKKAFAYDFIMNLPQKFDTVIGDRGLRLSGGEKQRISIARAILKDAPILILDEATSHLDSGSEQLVKDALYNLMINKTVFIIAHRLSTVQKADRILVMQEGCIVEEGTHDFLLEQSTIYKKLYEVQFNA